MTEPWSPVPESAAFAAAGTPADILRGDDVAYVLGPSATLVVVEAPVL